MKDLDIQVGDRVTFLYKNEKMVEIAGSSKLINKAKENTETLKIERIGNQGWYTVYEKNKKILDEAEKEYFKNLIKPFKKDVVYIKKCKCISGKRYFISVIMNNFACSFTLPYFEKNKMYIGMEAEKEYTLEELRIGGII